MKIGSLVKPSASVGQVSGGIYLYQNKEATFEDPKLMFLFKHGDVGVVLEVSYVIETYEYEDDEKNKIIDVIKVMTKQGIGWTSLSYVKRIK